MSWLSKAFEDPRRNARINVLLGVAALIVTIAFGTLGLVLNRHSASRSRVPGAPNQNPATEAIVEGWHRVPTRPGVFGNATTEGLYDVAYANGLYVAVGDHDSAPAIWTATNPNRWTRLDRVDQAGNTGSGVIWSVAFAGGVWVAVGEVSTGRATVWTSRDAVTWNAVPRSDVPTGTSKQYSLMASVVRFRGAWYAGGYLEPGARAAQVAAIWRSTDAEHWARVPLSTEAVRIPGDQPVVMHLAASGGRIVGVGQNDSLVIGRRHSCVVWTSTNGRDWVAGKPTHGSFAPRGHDCALDSVVYAHHEWVAIGATKGQGVAWSSTDGINWRPALIINTADLYGGPQVNDIAATRRGWLAVGAESVVGVYDAAVWDLKTPADWLQVDPDPRVFGGPDQQVMTAVVTDPSGAVAVGWDVSTGNPRGAVWVQQRRGSGP